MWFWDTVTLRGPSRAIRGLMATIWRAVFGPLGTENGPTRTKTAQIAQKMLPNSLLSRNPLVSEGGQNSNNLDKAGKSWEKAARSREKLAIIDHIRPPNSP